MAHPTNPARTFVIPTTPGYTTIIFASRTTGEETLLVCLGRRTRRQVVDYVAGYLFTTPDQAAKVWNITSQYTPTQEELSPQEDVWLPWSGCYLSEK